MTPRSPRRGRGPGAALGSGDGAPASARSWRGCSPSGVESRHTPRPGLFRRVSQQALPSTLRPRVAV
ncbi:hypothetical protein ACFFX0_27350 [Citricoccus parietis]|uniref:Uncharacterized protein n=1 Tax=Citricoccus parietis TaxID=592307 RepID=A0ABV5G6Y3_9MICC